jgi:hypothetical protein
MQLDSSVAIFARRCWQETHCDIVTLALDLSADRDESQEDGSLTDCWIRCVHECVYAFSDPSLVQDYEGLISLNSVPGTERLIHGSPRH